MASTRTIFAQRALTTDGEASVCIRVEDGVIAAIDHWDGSDESIRNHKTPHVRYTCGPWLLTPGLVNAHTHLALNALRGGAPPAIAKRNMVEDFFFAVETHLQPGDVEAFARMGAYESLLSGVTTVWDHYYNADEVARACKEVGIGAVIAPTVQDLAGPGKASTAEALALTAALDEDSTLKAAGIVPAVGVHATDTVSESLWQRAFEFAEKRNLPLHAHLAQSLEEFRFTHNTYGQSPVEFLATRSLLSERCVFAHAIFATQKDLRALEKANAKLVHCPHSQLVFAFPARADIWAQEGLDYALATDCAASNDSMNVLKEARWLSRRAGELTSASQAYADFLQHDLLQREDETTPSQTEGAAACWSERSRLQSAFEPEFASLMRRVSTLPGSWHPQLTVGTIAVGARADFALWNTEHPAFWPGQAENLIHSDVLGALHCVLRGGVPLFMQKSRNDALIDLCREPSILSTLIHQDDYRQAAHEAERRRQQLFCRAFRQ